MLNNIVTTILKREGKISLPSIGIIVRAEFDGDTTYLFTPTSAKTDSNIIAMIVSEMEVSQTEAVNVLDCYIDFIKSVVSKNGNYHLRGVGDILQNDSKIFYFMPLSAKKQETSVKEIIQEVRQEILEEEIVLEEVEESIVVVEEPLPIVTEEIVEEKIVIEKPIEKLEPEQKEQKEQKEEEVKEEPARLNERFQPRRLGEIMEGGANKRFYDKVHSQVVTADEPVSSVIKEENTTIKRKALYDIYDRGVVNKDYKHEQKSEQVVVSMPPPVPTSIAAPVPTPIVPSVPIAPVEQQPVSIHEPAPIVEQPQFIMPEQKPKKVDFVLIISILVIIVGLVFIAYFYFMQKDLGL